MINWIVGYIWIWIGLSIAIIPNRPEVIAIMLVFTVIWMLGLRIVWGVLYNKEVFF